MKMLSGMNWTDRALWGVYAVLLALHATRTETSARFVLGHLAILVLIPVLAANANRSRWMRFAHDWYPMFLFIAIFEEIARLSLVVVPGWRDAAILGWETAILGISPNWWFNQHQNAIVTEILEFGYFTFYWILPTVGGILYEEHWHRWKELRSSDATAFRLWMDATVMGYLGCYIFFLLFPTEGPAHTIGIPTSRAMVTGPFHWLVLLIQSEGGVHGNAFPSGHIMASTVALLAALRWKPQVGRWLVVPVLLMCLGAVYDGYHYASDIVAGAALGAIAFAVVLRIRGANRAAVA